MLVKLISKIWKVLPKEVRTFVTRRSQVKFTVSAAGIITNERGEVLLLNHVLRPMSGWGVPGGFLNVFEQPEAAFKREVKEETGLDVTDINIVRLRTLRRHIEIMFQAKGIGEATVKTREITELRWFAIEDMPREMSLDQQFLIRKVLGYAE